MLPKEHRLRLERDFKRVFERGRGAGSDFFVVKLIKRNAGDGSVLPTRIGCVVSAKVSKLSVVRNRVKRRMREIVRVLFKNDKIRQQFDVVIIAKPLVVHVQFTDMKNNLEALLVRVGVAMHTT